MDRSFRRELEELPVVIREVNTNTRHIVASDNYNNLMEISWHFQDPAVLTIPQVGEVWIIKRKGIDWFLFKRQDTGMETTSINDMSPGDKRIEASEKLYLTGKEVIINGPINSSSLEKAFSLALGEGAISPSTLESGIEGQVVTMLNGVPQWGRIPINIPILNSSSISDLILDTSFADVPNCQLNLNITFPNANAFVNIICDFEINTIGVGSCLAQLLLDDVIIGSQAILNDIGTAGMRATVGQQYMIPAISSGLHTLNLQASKTIGAGAATIHQISTTITAIVVQTQISG